MRLSFFSVGHLLLDAASLKRTLFPLWDSLGGNQVFICKWLSARDSLWVRDGGVCQLPRSFLEPLLGTDSCRFFACCFCLLICVSSYVCLSGWFRGFSWCPSPSLTLTLFLPPFQQDSWRGINLMEIHLQLRVPKSLSLYNVWLWVFAFALICCRRRFSETAEQGTDVC